MPQNSSSPFSRPSSIATSPADPDGEPTTSSSATPPTSHKTAEQIANEARREALRNEVYLDYGGGRDDISEISAYAPTFAIFSVALTLLFVVTDKRKPSPRKGRRAWFRGRF